MTSIDMLWTVFVLLFVFQIKHFICDYILQTEYMVKGKAKVDDWFEPLFAHAGVHAIGTLLIVGHFSYSLAWKLALADLILHFIVDRIKASPDLLGSFKIDDKMFWIALGWDQMLHHMINYFFIVWIIENIFLKAS